ncbi:MAG: hypothetical protein DWG78_01305 [Chloroflexi bacterium]|nr:hypothetical protein [Chloroflexota bacterium]
MEAEALAAIVAAFDLAPHQLHVFDPAYPRFDAQRPLLVLPAQFEAARPHVAARYPADLAVGVALEDGVTSAPIDALPSEATGWLLPALSPEQDVRGIAGIRGVVERLFSPDGCPWDLAQTPGSLATYFIEESYELVDAIEGGDPAEIREELGDILAHVFMQTAVAQRAGDFTVEDVVEYISRKLVRRHPHVYGDVDTDSPEEIERIWEQIKAQERAERDARDPGARRAESALDSVPNSAPGLVRVDQLIGRAERAGLTPAAPPAIEAATSALGVIAGTTEANALGASDATSALGGLGAADAAGDDGAAAIGALLWAAVRLAREREVDAEQALRLAANGFLERFRAIEDEARTAGIAVAELPPERHQRTWPPEPGYPPGAQ